MKVELHLYNFRNGEMHLILNTKKTVTMGGIGNVLKKWYNANPYAKRVDKNWICGDYRIDQQRPQRNVYSERYIKIVSISEMEERYFDKLIKEYESKIDYPTVWDDGKNRYYEETIYCPKCGKRRKVLTSHTHCEHCGFEFKKAIRCPKCNSLNLKGSNHCTKCNYEFRKKSFVNNNKFKVKKDENIEIIKCPKCGKIKSKFFDKCQECGFDYEKKKQCPKCKIWTDKSSKYCYMCGEQLDVFIECNECGKKNKIENSFCTGCGTKLK